MDLASMLLAAVLLQSTVRPAQVPSDFAIRLEVGVCTTDVVDTRDGTYVRDLGNGKKQSTPISLTSADTMQLFRLVTDGQLFDYASPFKPELTRMTVPSRNYLIRIQTGNRRHTIRWEDYGSSTPEAIRLRKALTSIHQVFLAMPSVKQLPPQEVACL